MKLIGALVLVLLAGCLQPDPGPTPTAAPYPIAALPTYDPYPAPAAAPTTILAPSCSGIEYPTRIWGDGWNIYTETCIASTPAGGEVYLYGLDGGAPARIVGRFLGQLGGCWRYKYELQMNGEWWVVAIIKDPGGVGLCSVSDRIIDRWKYIFIDIWK